MAAVALQRPSVLKPVVHYIVVTIEVPVVVIRCDLTLAAPSGVLAGQALLALLRGPAVRPCPPSCPAGVPQRTSLSGSAADGLSGDGSWQVARGRGASRWHVAECQRRIAADIWHAQQLAHACCCGRCQSAGLVAGCLGSASAHAGTCERACVCSARLSHCLLCGCFWASSLAFTSAGCSSCS